MPTIYLHCGAPKTGTSYMQVLFAKHSDDLVGQNIVYPNNAFVTGAKEGKITSGNGVEMANYIRPELPHRIADKTGFIDDFDRLLAQGDGVNFLFSSEFLVFPENERTSCLVKLISRRGYDVKVIYLVRDLVNAALSTYSQQVKRGGETRVFEEFLKTWNPHYTHHTNLLRAAFGAEAVSIYNYEEHKKDLPKLFFEKFLGCQIDVESKEVVNRSLSPKELELLRTFSEYTGDSNAYASTFVSDALMRLTAAEPSDNIIGRQEYNYLSERYAQSIDKINQIIIGQKIRISSGYQEELPKFELNDFERFTMAVLAKLVVAKNN